MTQTTRKGTYALFLAFDSPFSATVGSLGLLGFDSGTYCYTGSAMGGLDQRLRRHLSKEKKVRWHIDHLTMRADSMEAWESYPDFIGECDLAYEALRLGMIPVHKGFGCSDCRCRTHLFLVPEGVRETFLDACHLARFTP